MLVLALLLEEKSVLTAVEAYSHGHWVEQAFIWIWSQPASTAALTHVDWMGKDVQ